MNYYQMLENLHVVSNNKDRDDENFWSQELYSQSDFSSACLDAHLLVRKNICKQVEWGKNKMKNEQEIPKEYCPYCGKNLIRILSEQEQKKYKLRYVSEKIGVSNWDSIFAWKCPYCTKTWRR